MVTITRYDNTGLIDVSVERYGYRHSYRNVTVASLNRLLKQGERKVRRMTTHSITTIKLSYLQLWRY